jgi:hypothetical protein|tara:strand:- start:411 stop:854 length:444 start_codon:yes stop_codon:yes gene_type:complete
MKTYGNILTEKERMDMINFLQPHLKKFSATHPGLQTESNLHVYPEMKTFLKKINSYINNYKIYHCWANVTNGDDLAWHSHPPFVVKSLVYYLKNKNEIGTMFKKEGIKVEVTRAPENSLAIFDGKLEHSVPLHLPEERISIAIDLML